MPHCLPLSLAHTLRYTEYINKDFFLLLLLLELPSSSLLHLNSPLLSFFVRCFLSSFLSPLCLSALFQDRFCPMSHIVRVHFTALIHIFSVKKKKTFKKHTGASAASDLVKLPSRQPVLARRRAHQQPCLKKFRRVNLNTGHTTLNCVSSCFFPAVIFCLCSPHNHSDLW